MDRCTGWIHPGHVAMLRPKCSPHLVAFLFLKSSWIDPELTTRNNDRYHHHKWYIYIYMCVLCSYIYNVTIPKGCQLNEKQYGTTCVYNSHQQQPFTEYRRCIELWWASQKSQSYLYSLYTITLLRTPSSWRVKAFNGGKYSQITAIIGKSGEIMFFRHNHYPFPWCCPTLLSKHCWLENPHVPLGKPFTN